MQRCHRFEPSVTPLQRNKKDGKFLFTRLKDAKRMESFARLFKGGRFLRRSLKPLTAVSGILYAHKRSGEFENPIKGFSCAKHRKATNRNALMLRIGKPPARVSHGKIIHRMIFPPFLRFAKQKIFRASPKRDKERCSLTSQALKSLTKLFYCFAVRYLCAKQKFTFLSDAVFRYCR